MSGYEITFDYTPTLAVAVNRAYLWATRGGYIIASVIVAAVSTYCLSVGSFIGFWSFWLGVVVMCWYSWLQTIRIAYKNTSLQHLQNVKVTFDDTGCTFFRTGSTVWTAWSSIHQLYRLKPALVMERYGMAVSPIPTESLTPESIQFIERCVKEAGGIIR